MNSFKIKIKEYLQAQNWQRIGMMLCIGVFAIFVALYFSDDSPNSALLLPDKPLQKKEKENTLSTNNEQLGNNYLSNIPAAVAGKDPFRIPEKFKVLPLPPTTVIKPPSTDNKSLVNSELPKLKLTGIVGTGATREAIVEVSGKSRSYKKMDMITGSPYQLIYITASAAVFSNSRGEKITLTIGR